MAVNTNKERARWGQPFYANMKETTREYGSQFIDHL